MKTFALWLTLLLVGWSAPLSAEEIFFENGLSVGLDIKASAISRDKIHYGLWQPDIPVKTGDLDDIAPSPSLAVGYKFAPLDSVSVRGNWAHYSVKQHFTNNGSKGCGFGVVPIDGSVNAGSCTTPAAVGIDWKSDVAGGELEYQRTLWSDKLAGILALLGFQYRFEGQKFDAQGGYPNVPAKGDVLREKLKEHLFGPYAGFKTSFKPSLESRLSAGIKAKVGYLFKSASFRGRELFDSNGFIGFGCPPGGAASGPCSISKNDHASNGTVSAAAGADVVYALTKNWHVSLDYDFEWIHKAAHIVNPQSAPAPAKIGDSRVLTQRTGMSLIFKFD
jgi:hypothetical protein